MKISCFGFCGALCWLWCASAIAGELSLSTDPNHPLITIAGGRYVVAKKDDQISFKATPNPSLDSLSWNFSNGSPSTGSGNGPISVTYGASAEGVASPVTFTSSRTSTSNGKSVTCKTTNKTTVTVLMPKFKFENDDPDAHQDNIQNYIASGAVMSGGNINLSSKVTISLGQPNLDLGTISSSRGGGSDTFDPTQGSTDDSGDFVTVLTATQQGKLKVQFNLGSTQVTSDDHDMLPAVYKDGFSCTIYYTPEQSGFTAAGGYDMTLETRTGLDGQKYPRSFLGAAKEEGYGRLSTPYNGNSYVKYDGSWGFASAVVGNRNNTLVAKSSCAVDGHAGERTIPNSAAIEISNQTVQSTMGTEDFQVADVGGGVASHQIDMYFGEDNPASPSAPTLPAGASNYSGVDSATVILESY